MVGWSETLLTLAYVNYRRIRYTGANSMASDKR
jgi:hypothetical protein